VRIRFKHMVRVT